MSSIRSQYWKDDYVKINSEIESKLVLVSKFWVENVAKWDVETVLNDEWTFEWNNFESLKGRNSSTKIIESKFPIL